jgi:hypothetical protein
VGADGAGRSRRVPGATLFRVLRTAAGRWDAEEGHGDPSRACICLVPVELTAQTHWDAHSGGFC